MPTKPTTCEILTLKSGTRFLWVQKPGAREHLDGNLFLWDAERTPPEWRPMPDSLMSRSRHFHEPVKSHEEGKPLPDEVVFHLNELERQREAAMAKPKRKNPIFPRWHDPFFGTNRDYLAGKGGGDPAKGYDMILVQAIEDWNATAEKRGLPKTSKEHGMEWIPTAKRDKDGKLAGFRRLTEKELKEMNFYGD